MIKHKTNGDVFIGPVKVYSGLRRAPVRWLEGLCAVLTVAAFIAICTVFFGGFGRGY